MIKRTLFKIVIYSLSFVIILGTIISIFTNNYVMIFSPDKNIGNMLSEYYYNVIMYKYKLTLPVIKKDEMSEFLYNITKNTDTSIQKLPLSGDIIINNNIFWGKWLERGDPNFGNFWKYARPIIKDSYTKSIPYEHIGFPVIHFRCSDIPFIRYSIYHLQKAKFIDWVIDIIESRGFSTVIWLNCNSHLSSSNNCKDINDIYIKKFEQRGISVVAKCGTIIQDFATMVNSPLLVSLNPSSYSFMAGVSKEPDNYVSCNMGQEKNGTYVSQTRGDWLFSNEIPLLHSEVKDYYNTVVLEKLINGDPDQV
jgi:hypothetical protein